MTDALAPVQHQHGGQSAGIIFITRFMDSFLHQASFVSKRQVTAACDSSPGIASLELRLI